MRGRSNKRRRAAEQRVIRRRQKLSRQGKAQRCVCGKRSYPNGDIAADVIGLTRGTAGSRVYQCTVPESGGMWHVTGQLFRPGRDTLDTTDLDTGKKTQ